MTVDLLSVRLKEAKRELTNLKTAHLRGLGLLKLYTFTLDLDVQQRLGFWSIAVNIALKPDQSPFPFIQWVPIVNNDTSNVIELVGVQFSSDGMSVLYQFEWLASDPYVDTINLYSTSEISSYTQEWSQ